MQNWTFEKLPQKFVRYVYDGCVELGQRMEQEPELEREIRDVIQELISRTPLEALEIENGLSILTGAEIAKAIVACLRFLETYDEVEELGQTGVSESAVRLLRYLVARYGPVLKAIRRRHNHPLGWHKFGHAVAKLETGQTHLHLKVMRNDDSALVIEDDSDSLLRLINLMLQALDQADDHQSIDEKTIVELTANCERLLERFAENGTISGGGNRTEH